MTPQFFAFRFITSELNKMLVFDPDDKNLFMNDIVSREDFPNGKSIIIVKTKYSIYEEFGYLVGDDQLII
jgi:hypothetical protein